MQVPKDKLFIPPGAEQQIPPRNKYMVGVNRGERDMPERRLTQAERQVIWEKGKQDTESFQAKLKQYLSENGIPESDFTLDHQSPLGFITIICSPAVADLISKMPEVKAVAKDSKNVELIE